MLKKLCLAGVITGLLSATSLNLDMSKLFQNSKPWTVSMKSGGTYYMVSPLDINFAQLQKVLTNANQAIYVYTFYQRPELAAVDFGVKIFGAVKITKDKIVWAEFYKSDKPTTIDDNYADFKKDMLSHKNEVNIQNNAQKVFENSYVPNFEKIKANKIYLIQTQDINLSLNFGLKNISSIGNNAASSVSEVGTNTNSANNNANNAANQANNNANNAENPGTNTNDSIVYPPTPGINSNNEDVQTPPSPGLNNTK